MSPAKKTTQKSTKSKSKATTAKASGAFTADERAAMKARAQEQKAEARANKNRADGERALLEAIAGMKGRERAMAKRVHALVMKSAPVLVPRTYYGMPAYAKDGKTLCFFQPASKFKVRYSTFGFQPDAKVDDGAMWPVAYAVTELTPEVEARIAELVRKAIS